MMARLDRQLIAVRSIVEEARDRAAQRGGVEGSRCGRVLKG